MCLKFSLSPILLHLNEKIPLKMWAVILRWTVNIHALHWFFEMSINTWVSQCSGWIFLYKWPQGTIGIAIWTPLHPQQCCTVLYTFFTSSLTGLSVQCCLIFNGWSRTRPRRWSNRSFNILTYLKWNSRSLSRKFWYTLKYSLQSFRSLKILRRQNLFICFPFTNCFDLLAAITPITARRMSEIEVCCVLPSLKKEVSISF